MKLAIGIPGGILAIALTLNCGGARVSAQTESPTQKVTAANAEAASTTYRLTYTVTELDGAKHLGTQHFSMTVNPDAKDSTLKLGSRVPIATGLFKPDSASPQANVQYQYMDVGLNIFAHVREFATGVEVYSKLEQTSVAEEESGVGRSDPVIRQAVLQNTALLTLGKPLMLGSLDVPGNTRHLDIEVVLEVVR
ncbi:MAG TPA: hypothetical protein VGE83_11530 [Terracidiphilus sp.]|jgi:hypothetical protein